MTEVDLILMEVEMLNMWNSTFPDPEPEPEEPEEGVCCGGVETINGRCPICGDLL